MARLPEFIPPMLAKLGDAFDSDEYLFEIKWDGIRALALVEDGDYRLRSRRDRDLKDRYPEAAAVKDFPDGCAVDGELVVLEDGRPNFQAVLKREQARGARRIQQLTAELPVTYVVFDLLYKDGEPIMRWPLVQRREALQEMVASLASERIVFSEGIVGQGLAAFEHAAGQALEGVVAKRLQSRYAAGKRPGSWVKIKRNQRIYCAILGFLPDGEDDLKSLVLAAEDDGQLRYVGRVGSGLTQTRRRELNALLRQRLRDTPVLPSKSRDCLWVEPGLYCVVSFLERTSGGELRAPVFVELVS